jgi:hypothetical protein
VKGQRSLALSPQTTNYMISATLRDQSATAQSATAEIAMIEWPKSAAKIHTEQSEMGPLR